MAKIRIIGYLKELAKVSEKTIIIEEPTKLRNICPFLENLDEKRLIILINGKPNTLDAVIEDRDNVILMPIVGGG